MCNGRGTGSQRGWDAQGSRMVNGLGTSMAVTLGARVVDKEMEVGGSDGVAMTHDEHLEVKSRQNT